MAVSQMGYGFQKKTDPKKKLKAPLDAGPMMAKELMDVQRHVKSQLIDGPGQVERQKCLRNCLL